jgi:hypothetical protein
MTTTEFIILAAIAMGLALLYWWLAQKTKVEVTKAQEEKKLLTDPGFWLTITSPILNLAKEVVSSVDKDPETDSPLERGLMYAELAVTNAEQVYKKAKDEVKKQVEAGIPEAEIQLTMLNDEIKKYAVDTAVKFAESEGKTVSDEQKVILDKLVETQVGFQNRSKFLAKLAGIDTDSLESGEAG